MRENGGPKAERQIAVVDAAHCVDVKAKRFDERAGQHCEPILGAFPISDDDASRVELDVVDTKAKAFGQPQSGAVKKAGLEK